MSRPDAYDRRIAALCRMLDAVVVTETRARAPASAGAGPDRVAAHGPVLARRPPVSSLSVAVAWARATRAARAASPSSTPTPDELAP